jgi:cell division septation protein DedD
MADDESRGVHLSDKQVVFAFMAGTVAAVVVFLCGVLVGRGVQGARGPIEDAELTAAAAQEVSDGAAADGPGAGAALREGGSGVGPDDLSYPARLGKVPPAEQLKPVPPPPGEAAREIAPPDIPAEPVAQDSAAPGGAAATPAGTSAAASAEARYTVQVAAVTRRDEAEAIVKRLKAKAFEAFVLAPDDGDSRGTFRVRIGSFKNKREANVLAERLLREDKRYKPWVTPY